MTTSFLLKPFFLHLLPLLYTGSKRMLTLDDLRDVPSHIQATPARDKLEAALKKCDQGHSRYLLKACFKAFAGGFLGPIVPRFIMLLATYGGPQHVNVLFRTSRLTYRRRSIFPGQVYLVQDLTHLLSNPQIPDSRGWALVGAFIIVGPAVLSPVPSSVCTDFINPPYRSTEQSRSPTLYTGRRSTT